MRHATSDLNFRHFKTLRKAIVHKKTGILQFHTVDGFTGVLLLEKGQMNPMKKNKQLIQFLSHPMATTSWEDEVVNIDRVPAIAMVTDAINHIQWSDAYLQLISEMYSSFSHLDIEFSSTIFKSSLTDLSYNLFYQRVTGNSDYCVASFMLKNNPSNALLVHRVRVLTFNYVLGLIRAGKGSLGVKSLPQKKQRASKKSIITIKRIMGRIRGLSASS